MAIFSKKFIVCLLLFLIGFGVFSSAVFPVAPVHAQAQQQNQQQNNLPAIGEDQWNKMEQSKPPTGIIWGFILDALNSVAYALSFFFALIIRFEAGILNYILTPENFPMTKAPVVVEGWKITRTTVNMFFVLVLLVVAFATILRIETYSLKAILPRLIIVALLINFSLVIAGVVLDFTNVMTNFFYGELTKDGVGDIALKLVNGLRLSKFFEPNADFKDIMELGYKLTTGPLVILAAMILSLLFLLATVFIFAALIVMMLIRILYLWVLLILAPAAWFFYIIPAWQNQWHKWWSNFFRWAFFAPIAMFFIYLSITTLNNMEGHLNTSNLQNAFRATMKEKNYPMKDPIASIFQFGVGTALILGSLMVANSMSITGAGMATGLGKKMGVGIAGAAGSYMRKRTQPASGRLAQGLANAFDKTRIGRLPVFRQLSRPLHRYAESGRQYQKKLEEEARKRSPEYLKNNFDKVGDQQKLAYSSVLADQNKLNTLDDGQIEKTLKLAEKTGDKDLGKKILNYDPTLANKIGGNFLDGVMKKTGATLNDVLKQLKPDDWAKMNDNSFAGLSKELLKTGRGNHIGKLAEQGEFGKLDIIQKEINNSFEDEQTPEMKKYLNSQAGQALLSSTYKKRVRKTPFSTA